MTITLKDNNINLDHNVSVDSFGNKVMILAPCVSGCIFTILEMGNGDSQFPVNTGEDLDFSWRNTKSYRDKLYNLSYDETKSANSFRSREEIEDYQNFLTLKEFSEDLIKNQQELDPQISKAIDEHFWDLI